MLLADLLPGLLPDGPSGLLAPGFPSLRQVREIGARGAPLTHLRRVPMGYAHTVVRNAPKLSELDQELAEKWKESFPLGALFFGRISAKRGVTRNFLIYRTFPG